MGITLDLVSFIVVPAVLVLVLTFLTLVIRGLSIMFERECLLNANRHSEIMKFLVAEKEKETRRSLNYFVDLALLKLESENNNITSKKICDDLRRQVELMLLKKSNRGELVKFKSGGFHYYKKMEKK